MNSFESHQISIAAVDFWTIAGIVIVTWVVACVATLCSQSPRCNRFFAFEKTDVTRVKEGWLLSTTYTAWRCKHCKHREWRKQVYSSAPKGQ